jgi:hypothetical protein
MKILANHSIWDKVDKMSAVDLWRIYRPLEELKKHVDWTIEYSPTIIPNLEKYKDKTEFTEEELEKACEWLGTFDIVFSSYFPNATAYSLLKVVQQRYGTKFVLDVDDDMFAINPDNPFWMKMDDEKAYWMQCMIRDNDYITTTTEDLAKVFRERRVGKPKESVIVLPNAINEDYRHPPFDNGKKIVIGYFGGSSHYSDLHESGVLKAIEKIMHENKNVHFKSVGMVVDKYTPKARTTFVEGKRGTDWTDKVFPTMKFDISIAPLLDNIFNKGKSNIKWQESTRAGSAFIASNIGPYRRLMPETAILCQNTEDDWYRGLKKLVDDKELRQKLVTNSTQLLATMTMDKQWKLYKKAFERVNNENNQTSK